MIIKPWAIYLSQEEKCPICSGNLNNNRMPKWMENSSIGCNINADHFNLLMVGGTPWNMRLITCEGIVFDFLYQRGYFSIYFEEENEYIEYSYIKTEDMFIKIVNNCDGKSKEFIKTKLRTYNLFS